MQAAQVLSQLQEMGIHLSAHGGMIRAEPKTALTNEARQLIRTNKAALLEVLQGATNQETFEAAREAAAERAAILEYDAGWSRCEADIVAALAEAFYRHLFGSAKATNCCYAPAGRYCAEGERLRTDYYDAAEKQAAHQRRGRTTYGK